jgi:hypothetical protein
MLLDDILFAAAVVAIVVAGLISHLRIAPWWILPPGGIAAVTALALYTPISSCNSTESEGLAFGVAILACLTLFTAFGLSGLFDAVRFARAGAGRDAAGRLALFFLGALLVFGTLVFWVFAFVSCLE